MMPKEPDPTWRTPRPNEFRIEGDTAILTLTQGQETVIDKADLPLALRFRWYAHYNRLTHSYYARASVRGASGDQRTARLHRYIMQPSAGLVVDHINHDTLDNRRSNLRVVSHAGNTANKRGARRDSSTGELGIHMIVRRKRAREYHRYVFMCCIGKSTSGHGCVSRWFPQTPEGLAAAIAYRNAHWRSCHPDTRAHLLPPAADEEAA